jgi:catechol 2,3-dioxygenase-like lactoylglutathione lyase family enzyme
VNWTLELVCVPVTDVDRAKTFYADGLGFAVDHDTRSSEGNRFVQLTPPGSGCSIMIGSGVVPMPAGSLQGLQLVVSDVRAARAELVARGVEVSEVEVCAPDGLRPARPDDDLDNVGVVHLTDPDGNGWAIQQITARGQAGNFTAPAGI